jgi:hypothetical protein
MKMKASQQRPDVTAYALAKGSGGAQPTDEIEQRILTANWDAVKNQWVVVHSREAHPYGTGGTITRFSGDSSHAFIEGAKWIGQMSHFIAKVIFQKLP